MLAVTFDTAIENDSKKFVHSNTFNVHYVLWHFS